MPPETISIMAPSADGGRRRCLTITNGNQIERRPIGREVDLNLIYAPGRQVTLFGLFGWFDPGLAYGPAAADALKGEVGITFRF